MAGYSGTPLPKKLGIKPDTAVAILGAPEDFERTLGELPERVQIQNHLRGAPAVILLFVTSQAQMEVRWARAADALAEGGRIWIIWPKKISGMPTDLTQNQVRAFGLGFGFVDFKVCAVDATWSGLAFARRAAKRAASPL
ncbi:MAG: DUF3052 domain-containing protein [Acidobacteria bacterium]|nr:DUF3052 domain-containing protein [Acidobacteriota bacterium]